MTPASVAAVSTALDMIRSEPEHLQNLQKVVKQVRDEFRRIGYPYYPDPHWR